MNEPRLVLDGESLITPEAVSTAIASRAPVFRDDQLATATAELGFILHTARQWFDSGQDPVTTMRWTVRSLHETRRRYEPGVWRALVPMVQEHAVAEYFHQDPFTRWSFEKPRGYSGDAQLIDFIYQHETIVENVENATPLGQALYAFTKFYPSCVAVRERRDVLAREVDKIAASRGRAEVLAVAAGHLREAHQSVALGEGRIGRWIALDQDPLSLESIDRDFAGTAVATAEGSVLGLLRRAYDLGSFDFIYAAGLYDYLSPGVAGRLTQRCLEMLKPDGAFLFANFSDEMSDDGYMETFMNWSLLQRSEDDMWGIINASVDRNRVDAEVYYGENRNIIYGVIRKRG